MHHLQRGDLRNLIKARIKATLSTDHGGNLIRILARTVAATATGGGPARLYNLSDSKRSTGRILQKKSPRHHQPNDFGPSSL
jgi:hypothetical protein